MKRPESPGQQGFTIVELMIALSILSVLLIVSTVALIQIGRLYSKGVNAANLQSANRAVISDVSGQLQFSGKVPPNCTQSPGGTACYTDIPPDPSLADITNTADGTSERAYSYCIGNTRYTFVLNRELGTDPSNGQITRHVLWRDTLTDTSSCPVADIVNGTHLSDPPSRGDGYEMLGNHMRLTRFNVRQTAADNGIYNADIWMAFGDSDLVQTAADGSSTCRGIAGTQFCAVSSISTQLTGRIY
jgi:prepilin-type N-terminal cleavage/methylation domain-containing protein